LWSRSTAEFRSSSVTRWAVPITNMCTPSELVSLRYRLRECYEAGEGDDDDRRKEPSANKSQLFDAIWSLLRDLDAATNESATVRSEFRALKTAVFANASNGIVTQGTQDCLDRPNTGWDAIHKLAAEQNPPTAPPSAAAGTGDGGNGNGSGSNGSGRDDDEEEVLNALLFTQGQAEFQLVEAKRATQYAKQQATHAKKERQRDERRQVREQEHTARREEYERKHGRPPVCPRYNRSEECDRTQCKDIGNGRFSHPDRCMDPAHVVRGLHGDCLLWHFWDKVKSSEFAKKQKEKAAKTKASNSQWGTKGSNNGGGYPQKKSGKNGGRTVNGNSRQTAWSGNPGRAKTQPMSKEMVDLQAQVAEMKTLLSLRRTEENWPPMAKSLPPATPSAPPPAPSPTEALKQIAALLMAYA
jgi:hypothetical protein